MKRDGHAGRAWTKTTRSIEALRRESDINFRSLTVSRLTDLEACREAWAAGDPMALVIALDKCVAAGGLPAWLARGLKDLLFAPEMKRRWEPYRRSVREYVRFLSVCKARQRGLTWESAFNAASQELRKTSVFGSAAAMKKSYQRIRKRPPVS